MTHEDAARIVRQTTVPRSGSIDRVVEFIEAAGINVYGLSPEDAHANAPGHRATIEAAQGSR